MDFQEYTNGKRKIKATVVTYESIYRAQGFKPYVKETAKAPPVRRGSSNTDNVKVDKPEPDKGTEQGAAPVLGGEVSA